MGSGEDLVDATQPRRRRAATGGVTPGNDGAIALQGRKGIESGEDLGDTAKPRRRRTAIVTPGDDGAIALQGRKGRGITDRPPWPIDCHHHPLRRDRGGGRLLAGGDHVAGCCCWGGHDLGNDRFTRINHAVGQRR